MKSKNKTNDSYHLIARKCKKTFVEKSYEMNLGKITLKKDEPFTVNGIKLILNEDTKIDKKEQGFFVLDMTNRCDIADIDIFPAEYVVCESLQDEYRLSYRNVLIGGVEDICIN